MVSFDQTDRMDDSVLEPPASGAFGAGAPLCAVGSVELIWRAADGVVIAASPAAEALWAAVPGSLSGRRLEPAMPAARALLEFAGEAKQQSLVFWTDRGSRQLPCQISIGPAAGTVRVTFLAAEVAPRPALQQREPAADDAETLVEIARMIRERLGGGPAAAPADSDNPAGLGEASTSLPSGSKPLPGLAAALLDALNVPAVLVAGSERLVSPALLKLFNEPGPDLPAAAMQGVDDIIAGRSRRLVIQRRGAPPVALDCTCHSLSRHELGSEEPAVLVVADGSALAQAEAAEEERRQIEFFAKVSHEIRTPLSSIIGFAEVMRAEALGPIAEAQIANSKYRGYVEDMLESAQHALSLINDLLDLSRIRAGALPLDPVQLDVGETVRAALATLKPQADKAGIGLEIVCEPGLPEVIADRRSIKQMVLNLAGNAIKFTAKGGEVRVVTESQNGGIAITVSDTGAGMTPDEVSVALLPFRQAGAGTAAGAGSGLGLPLTKALAEANGATLTIDSTPGRGTRMRFTFPAGRLVPV